MYVNRYFTLAYNNMYTITYLKKQTKPTPQKPKLNIYFATSLELSKVSDNLN